MYVEGGRKVFICAWSYNLAFLSLEDTNTWFSKLRVKCKADDLSP
jgi:hypothetical protein